MNTSSEAADQVVRMSLQGTEFTLRVGGKAAKEVIALLVALNKSKTQVKGKTNLNNMLKTGQPLKVFSVKKEDFKKFCEEAKRYGILYSALSDKNSKDGVVDILVMEKDASKINRIVDRFNFAKFKEADIISDIKERKKQNKKKGVQEKDSATKIKEEKEINPKNKEETQSDPYVGRQVRENQSEPSSNTKESLKTADSKKTKKKSVKKELDKYKEVVKNKEKSKTPIEDISKSIPKKSKER